MEEIAIEVPHGRLDLREIDRESPIAVGYECAPLPQIVELQRHTLSVRLMQAKAEGSESGRQEAGIELSFRIRPARQQLVVEHVLQHEQARDIRLGFLDGAVELLDLLARR